MWHCCRSLSLVIHFSFLFFGEGGRGTLVIYSIFPYLIYLSRNPRIYPCKFFLAGVNFYRFNAKNWQFNVYIVVIYAFFGVNFILQRFCSCKKNHKYQVCARAVSRKTPIYFILWLYVLWNAFYTRQSQFSCNFWNPHFSCPSSCCCCPLDDHLQEAGPSGWSSLEAGHSRWWFTRSLSLRMVICKWTATPDDNLQEDGHSRW